MSQNVTKQTVVIGYYDENGYAYCLKHGRSGMEEIYSDGFLETCSICGEYLDPIETD